MLESDGNNQQLIPNGLCFKRPNGGSFKVDAKAIKIMQHFAQYDLEGVESGGILLGRHIINTSDIIVDQITTPSPEDSRSRFRFFRSRKYHQDILDRAWKESAGTSTYLGEWHTHPEQTPSPSSVDISNWRRKLKNDKFSGCLFFVIIGIAEIHVWEGNQDSIKISHLDLEK